jgi:hypothetical protein
VVTTDDATDITATSATLNGAVKRLGAGARVAFLWGEDDTTVFSTGAQDPAATRVSHDAALTALKPGTIYYFRIVAEEADGARKVGAMKSFRTSPAVEPEAAPAGGLAAGERKAATLPRPADGAAKGRAAGKAPGFVPPSKPQRSGEGIRPPGGP